MTTTTPRDYTMKYDKRGITNPVEKLHPGEPWFFLRAQDVLSVDTLRAYGELLKGASDKQRGINEPLADELLKQSIGMFRVIDAFMDWQDANKELVKLPD